MNYEEYVLLINEETDNLLSKEEAEKVLPIIEDFIEDYQKNGSEETLKPWLAKKLSSSLPKVSVTTTEEWANEIVSTLQIQHETKKSLDSAIVNGKTKESWFADKIKTAVSYMSAENTVEYLQQLDDAVNNANSKLMNTILNKNGNINNNPNLDGYIAEQHHVQTFNMNAVAKNSNFRARVLEPDGSVYSKNGVDIVIDDIITGKTIRKYQAKYGKDSITTEKLFGNKYKGQQKLIPSEQSISKKHVSVIESPDGIKSTPLTKAEVKQLQNEVQSGNINALKKDFNDYALKDITKGIGKNVAVAGVMGAACAIGAEIIEKKKDGEELTKKDVVSAAFRGGSDAAVKAAITGALKVSVERGLIKAIPKGTPAGQIANVVFVGVENAKIIGKIVKGEYSVTEGIGKMTEVTVSSVAGIACAAKGAQIGAGIGLALGPVGAAIGGFIGGTVGYMAGSAVGTGIVKIQKNIKEKATNMAKATFAKAKSAISSGMKKIFGKTRQTV